MNVTYNSVEIEQLEEEYQGEVVNKATLHGRCKLASFQYVLLYTASGLIRDPYGDKPLFGCKNYNKHNYRQCVALSTSGVPMPCPVLTDHQEEMRLSLVCYLLNNGFIDPDELLQKNPHIYHASKTASLRLQ